MDVDIQHRRAVPHVTSMFPKPGRSSPSRTNLNHTTNNNNNNNSPSKTSGSHSYSTVSTGGDRLPTGAQSPSTIHPSLGRGHRATTDLNFPSNSASMKDGIAYHSHRSSNSAHHYYHNHNHHHPHQHASHGSSHHYPCRENAGHTGNDSMSNSTHDALINPTHHHHTYNTNYHSYTTYHHHGGSHFSSYRSNNPAYHLRDFMLTQWRQFESSSSGTSTPRSTPVETVSVNGSLSSDLPARSAQSPSSSSSSFTPAALTNPANQVTDRTTPTGSVLAQPPESPASSDHSGSLPRRHQFSTLENAASMSAENVHTLSGSVYRQKLHGTSRGVLGSPLARHGSSEMNTWQRGQVATRKNSSPNVFVNRGSSNMSSPRGIPVHGASATTTAALVCVSSATPSAAVSVNNNCSSVSMPPPSNLTIQTTTTATTPNNNNNLDNHNNNNNATDVSIAAGDDPAVSGPTSRTGSPAAAAVVELSSIKQSRVASPTTLIRPKTAEPGVGRKTRTTKVLETECTQVPSPEHAASLRDDPVSELPALGVLSTENKMNVDNANPVSNCSNQVNNNHNSSKCHEGDRLPTQSDCSEECPIGKIRGLSELPRSPVPFASSSSSSHTISDPAGCVRPSSDSSAHVSPPEASAVTVTPLIAVMSVNVAMTPPSSVPPATNDWADTPTASGEQYWTPDPPASPSNEAILAAGSSSPTAMETHSCDFSECPTPSPKKDPIAGSQTPLSVPGVEDSNDDDDDESVNVVCRVSSVERPRLESLNDVD